MQKRRAALNDRQLEVLRWVGQGCPEREWPDTSYKTTALALQNRGLAIVSKKGGTWSCEITDRGRYYLGNGEYPPVEAPRGLSRPAERQPAGRRLRRPTRSGPEVPDLIPRLEAAGGTLVITDPSPEIRGAYRRAINAASSEGLAPDGFVVRHSGRDHGDLVIRLVNSDDLPRPSELPSVVPVVDTLDREHPLVLELMQRSDGIDVSDAARERASRLVQSIAEEAGRRGYVVHLSRDQPGFTITIGDEEPAHFTLHEEYDEVVEFLPEDVEALKYSWQRATARNASKPSGRLVLTFTDKFRPRHWADRKRWRLEDKLPQALQYAEDKSQQARERREEREEEARAEQAQWEAAIPVAQDHYIEALNRQRMNDQADAWSDSTRLRAYAAAVRDRASALDAADAACAQEWADWIDRQAQLRDPLSSARLEFLIPDEVPIDELDRYMPRGMTAAHPPGERRRSW